ncbi:MAG: pilus assembly protein [Chloroflexota bacterium]
MTQHIIKSLINRRGKGQSLVEVALFLPIFLIVIAGLVEVASILVTQNNVHNAARVGARFGSNGGQDEGIALSALNAVTDVLKIEDGYWDVWAVRGQVAADGRSFAQWSFNHVYGLQQTEAFSDIVEADIQTQVLQQLQTDQNGSTNVAIAGGIEFVGAYLIYDLESILGMDALANLVGFNSVRSLNVMRNSGTDVVVTEACTAFPIAVDEGIRSVLDPTDPSNAQNKWRSDFDYPTPAPNYYSFVSHQPNIPFLQAREGYLYNIQNGASSGGKGWLAWNQCDADLVGSLAWPGNSNDYTPSGGNCVVNHEQMPKFPGFMEVGDNTDKSMHIGDWVAVNTGSVNSDAVNNAMAEHVGLGRTLRLIVYKDVADAGGSNAAYRISRYAIMRLIGYSLNQGQGESFILAEFIRWDDSCGQVTP